MLRKYRFDRAPGSVKFYADGRLMKNWTTEVPGHQMKLYTNAWYLIRLEGKSHDTDRFVLVDQIRHAQYEQR